MTLTLTTPLTMMVTPITLTLTLTQTKCDALAHKKSSCYSLNGDNGLLKNFNFLTDLLRSIYLLHHP